MTDDTLPWDDCKIAFGFDGDEDFFDEIWEEDLRAGDVLFPEGWSINETDKSGARMVVVFRVEGLPIASDAERVREMLDQIERGIKPEPVLTVKC